MKVALVCIAKNEDNYIQEWVSYHLKLGFDNIFIYQNDWRTDITNTNVIKIELDGENKQRIAYNHFIKSNLGEYDWAAFFDVDEFLVLKKHKNVKEFINDYYDYNSIGISWVFFGDNNHTQIVNNNYGVINRFTLRQKNIDEHVKCILKLNSNLDMDVHNPHGIWVDTNYQKNNGPYSKNPTDNIAQLNHYYCKTKEEFSVKIEKGRADIPESHPSWRRGWDLYDKNNFNEIEDLTAYNFFYNDNNNILNT
jgi:hypothetical protein